MKYAWIKEHRDSFPAAVLCDVLRVSPSGYYASLDRAPGKRAMRHERIKQSVAAVHAESHGITVEDSESAWSIRDSFQGHYFALVQSQ